MHKILLLLMLVFCTVGCSGGLTGKATQDLHCSFDTRIRLESTPCIDGGILLMTFTNSGIDLDGVIVKLGNESRSVKTFIPSGFYKRIKVPVDSFPDKLDIIPLVGMTPCTGHTIHVINVTVCRTG